MLEIKETPETEKSDFEIARDKFIFSYLNTNFPKDLRQYYGDIMKLVKSSIEAGAAFTKNYYNLKS